MPAPQPIWWDPFAETPGPTSTWNCGTVDADSWSTEKEFWIFNNKGGSVDVSDMTNVFITTKDSLGLDGPPVADMSKAIVWVKVFDGGSSAWGTQKMIGGSTNIADILNCAGWIDTVHGDTKANRLWGGKNPTDPTDSLYDDANTKKKMAKVRLQLQVLAGADAGPMTWKTRVSYQYT